MKSEKKPPNTIFYGNYKDMIYNASPEDVKEIIKTKKDVQGVTKVKFFAHGLRRKASSG